MEEKHLIDKFLEFEEKNNLFDIKIRGINIWYHIRFDVYSQIISKKNDLGRAHFTKTRVLKFKDYLLNFLPSLFFHNPLTGLRKVDFLVFNHSRRIFSNGRWEEPYSDRFIESNRDKKFYIYENAYNGSHKRNVFIQENRKYQDILSIISTILANINKIIFPLKKEESRIINDLQLKINHEFSLTVDISRIKYDIFYCGVYKKLLRYIISRTKPEKIYEVVYYDQVHMLVNQVAKEMNILTYEFQHGTMGRYHIAYNYKKIRNHTCLPDKVYFYNEFWKNNTRLPIKEEDKIIYGNPYLEAMKKKYSKAIKKDNKKTILFLSQGTIGDKLSNFAIKLSADIDTEKYKIIYKLHPSEYFDWQKRYPNLISSSIKVIDNNKKHLYELFIMSDIQIGVSSTAIYEGLEFGLKTFILKVHGWEYMEDLISIGKAILIEKPEELIGYVEK